MELQITARQCDVGDDDRQRVRDLVDRWQRFESGMMDGNLVFSVEGQDHSVEAVIRRKRTSPVVATGRGPDFRGALQELDDRVSRILSRDRQRRKDRRAPTPDPVE